MTSNETKITEINNLLSELTLEEIASIPVINTVLKQATVYTFNAITGPAAESWDASMWNIQVSYRGKDTYAILHNDMCYHKKGEWDMEPISSSRTKTFIKTHRFPLEIALSKAKKLAEEVTMMGRTAKQFEEWYEEKFPEKFLNPSDKNKNS